MTQDRPTLSFRAQGDSNRRDPPADPYAVPAYREGLARRRFWAWIIDQLCIWALIAVCFLLVALLTVATLGLFTLFGLSVLVLAPFLYHTLFVVSARGTTLGMMAMKVVVRRADGEEPEIAEAALRILGYYVSVSFLTPLILFVALFNDRRQTLHDFLTSTVVVRDI